MSDWAGIDVSGFQSDATLQQWISGSGVEKIDFAIVKGTEGQSYLVASHPHQAAIFRAAGVPLGHYHYAWPENGGLADARNFINYIKAQPGDTLHLDFEPFRSKSAPTVWAQYIIDFAKECYARLGAYPSLYLTDSHGPTLVKNSSAEQMAWIRANLWLWKAGVGYGYLTPAPTAPAYRGETYGWPKVALWQWVASPVDRNVLYGGRATWDAMAIPGTSQPPPPAKEPDPVKLDCTRVQWRGVTVCAHMVPKLNAWAKNVGQDILLKPLPGCGSYQTSTAASAGTHAGGGAIDIDLRGYSAEQCRRVETEGRRVLNLAYHRPAINGVWTDHAHALDASCPKLSRAAAAQFPLYSRGLNALANNGPDTGSRTFVIATMVAFAQRLVQQAADAIITAVGSTYTVKSGDTLGKIAAAYKVTVAQLASWNGIKDVNVISVGQVLKTKAPTVVAKPPAPKPAPAAPVLKRGSSGTAVFNLQKGLLAKFPLYAGGIKNPGGGPNKTFGPQTEKVVREFQRRTGIFVDGIVGAQTWRELGKFGIKP